MKILAVDTATTSCSVAVVHNDAVLAETTLLKQQTHSKHLMDTIDHVVGLSGLTISSLSGFALTIGPGTFTGLRIGLSSIKGLAMASHRPVVGISSLDAIAMQAAPTPHTICSMIDARRGEVYFSIYRCQGDGLIKEAKDAVLPPEAAAEYIKGPCVFVGSGALTYRRVIQGSVAKKAYFMPAFQNIIKASTVAHLSIPKFKSDETDDVGSLVPYYIRRPDAELKRSFDNGL